VIYTRKKSFGGSYTRQHMATKRTVAVEVCPDDIAQGEACSRSECPLGRAVLRATGLTAKVYSKDLHLFEGNQFVARVTHSPEVAAWLDRLDRGERVEPISFALTF
jgi:hypothetical protein